MLASLSFAYYPSQELTISAIYMENNNLTSAYANLTIYDPSNEVVLDSVSMTEYTIGKFSYDYSFLDNVTGGYKAEVSFYNSSWDYLGIASENYDVQYNYTETLDNITYTVEQNNGLLNNIWDWIQVTIFKSEIYDTILIGKVEQFNKILFYTKANYVLSECDIFINTVHYNMTVDNKIATKYFYLNDGGNYDWNVTCN